MAVSAAAVLAAPAVVSPEMSEASAAGACMMFIKRSLHDPDSAEFGMTKDATINIRDGRALVLREVRAKNGFGAMRKTVFGCILEKRGDMIMPVSIFENGKQNKRVNDRIKKWKLG